MSYRCAACAGPVLGLAVLLGLASVPARAALPTGWAVYTFAGRIHEIEPDGGVLACATDGGLLFFDPATSTFAPVIADAGCTDGDCLTSNHLTSVSRDATGAYWLGTEAAGAVVFRPGASPREFGRFFTLNTQPGGGLLADSVTCIEAWRDETVYVGTSRGVAQIDVEAGVDSYNDEASRRLGSALKGTLLHDLAVDSLYVWVATDSGVSRYDRRPPYTSEFLPDSLTGREAFTVEILAGTLYAGTNVGIFRWQETQRYWQRVRNCSTCGPQTPPAFRAYSIARLPNGWLLVASEASVYLYNGFVWGPQSPPVIPLITPRRFTTIVATGDTIWTGQHNDDGEGGYLETWSVSQPTWRHFEPNAIPPSEVKSLRLGPGGELWVGTWLGGVARLATDGIWCIWNGNDPTVSANMTDDEGHVSALLATRNGGVWFTSLPNAGESRAVDVLAPPAACDHASDGWSHVQPGQEGFSGRYWGALQDGEGNIFMLADGEPGDALWSPHGGIDIVSEDRADSTNLRADVLGGSAVGALAFETTNGPWNLAYVGLNGETSEGLLQWTRSGQLFPPDAPTSGNFFRLSLPDTLDIGGYRDIVVTPGNSRRLWVGTDNFVFEYDVSAQRILTMLAARRDAGPGLLSGDVKDLQFDDFGNLWVATVLGLNRVQLADRQPGALPVVDAFTTIEAIRALNAASGVGQLYDPRRALAPLPSPLVNSLAYDAGRDLLHIGTLSGLATLDVEEFSQEPVIALDEVVLYPNPVRIDAGHQEVRIAFVSEPATVTIYTLEGEIVCEITDREDGDVVWSLGTPSCLDSEGNYRIASGIYPVRITTTAGSAMRTLVVIR